MSNVSKEMKMLSQAGALAAYAMARGKDGMADVAFKLAGAASRDVAIDEGYCAGLYAEIRQTAETIALNNGEPLAPQTDESRASQVSKLTPWAKIGVYARANDAVLKGLDRARERGRGKVTAFNKCGTALLKTLAKKRDADEATLLKAVDAVDLTKKQATASDAVNGVIRTLQGIAFGSDTKPTVHAGIMALLAAELGGDAFTPIMGRLENLATRLARLEEAGKELDPVPVIPAE